MEAVGTSETLLFLYQIARHNIPEALKDWHCSIQQRPDQNRDSPKLLFKKYVKGALSKSVKWPQREAQHSLPSKAEFKDERGYTSTSPLAFRAWYLLKNVSFVLW